MPMPPGGSGAGECGPWPPGCWLPWPACWSWHAGWAPAHPGWLWVRAFSEAALVGGLADWFAVTALFRHPLGLPIPHTAIIPANKERIADSMAGFLRAHFLTPQVVARRLRVMNLAAMAGGFLGNPRLTGDTRLRQAAADLIGDILLSPNGDQLGALVKAGARRQLGRVDIATLLGRLLTEAIADQRHRRVIEGALRWAGYALAENEALLRGMIHRQAGDRAALDRARRTAGQCPA